MTKSEFEVLFNKCYSEALSPLTDTEGMKERLLKCSSNKSNLTSEDLFVEALLISTEFSALLLRSVLKEVLQFDN